MTPRDSREWLETDGLGGFASGTVSGIRTRRYHALLLTAVIPPTGRMVLVNGLEASVRTPAGRFAISSQAYLPDVIYPDGASRIASFDLEPWPRWTFLLEDGSRLEHEIFVPRGSPRVVLSWRMPQAEGAAAQSGRFADRTSDPAEESSDPTSMPLPGPVPSPRFSLEVRLLMSGRDFHATHHENPAFAFTPIRDADRLIWRPYLSVPGIFVESNGAYEHSPTWYRSFLYAEERERGLEFTEDLASPGMFRFDLGAGEAVLLLTAEAQAPASTGRDRPHERATISPASSPRRAGNDVSRDGSERRPPTVARGQVPGPQGLHELAPREGDQRPLMSLVQTLRARELARRAAPPAAAPAPAAGSRLESPQPSTGLGGSPGARASDLETSLDRAAETYLVRRGDGLTIIAGYPWFSDWGRDTFVALRGLCLARDRWDAALAILLQWAGLVSEGMLPNVIPDGSSVPEYNSVDASLWYIVAAHELLEMAAGASTAHGTPSRHTSPTTAAPSIASGSIHLADADRLRQAVESILEGYARGTRFGIHADTDGLLAAGVPGLQLTWMDAKVGDHVITPRIGKPVDVQALWLNALYVGSRIGASAARWKGLLDRAYAAFQARFWYADEGYLYDVVDVDHRAGSSDPSFRPNQIFAIGGLPFQALSGDRARRVVDQVEGRLATPLGLRSLAPGEPGYAPSCTGGPAERDAAYHQGTVWPWLMGPFVEAWVRVRGGGIDVRREARRRFLAPLLENLGRYGLGHLPEIADAEPPFTPRGCPFQAWSLGEAMRLDRVVLPDGAAAQDRPDDAASAPNV